MILQSLTRYYEALLSQGKITPPGWVTAKVSYALALDDQGSLKQLLHLQDEVPRGKKMVLTPRSMEVPAPAKRSANVAASFLCDNCGYLLGMDKGNPARTAECFAASKALHLDLLKNAGSPAARAVIRFFETWDPSQAKAHPALQEDLEDLMKGGNLIFWYHNQPVTQDAAIREAWQAQYASTDAEKAVCLVTGRYAPMARLHPSIKGVSGAQSTGASMVSFNAPAFCSFEHEQGANAPTSEYAAFAYTTALNHLIADRDHMRRVGDTTIVCWADNGEPAYQDCMMACMYDDSYTEQDIVGTLHALADGRAIDWQESRLNPDMRFYVLGLAPNAGRLSVRFFWQNTFGTLARNLARHYDRLNIIRPSFDTRLTLPVWQLARETVNLNARTPEPNPRLAGDLLSAVLNDGRYPATLLDGVVLRIRAERNITRGRAAILKAYYLRNSQDKQLKEVMTVELNEQSTYLPYVLGRMFSVLEAIQESANPGINTTIKDRYFNSASSTPSNVFPVLINLAQKHLAKLDKGLSYYYSKQLTDLNSRITETLPTRMGLPEQSAFQIGYYHQTQKRYTKKEEK